MRRALSVAALLVIAAGLGAPSATAQDKSYHFPEVEIEATVNPDGSLSLVEHRTFDFNGDFSFAFFTIEPTHAPPENILDFAVSRDGEPQTVFTSEENGGFKA